MAVSQSPMRTLSLRHLLATHTARIAAACLLLLIALPFTAPFSTCNLNDVLLHIGFDEGSTESLSDKIASDTALPVFGMPPVPVLFDRLALAVTPAHAIGEIPQASRVPLRV